MAAARLPYAAAILLWAVVGCSTRALAGGFSGDDDPRAWLTRTDQALTTRNYEGVFVHEHAGQTETLRVIHRVSADGVAERLLSMDGSGREFIRKGTELICYLPDKRIVLVEKSPAAGLLLSGLPRIDAQSASQYTVKQTARTRVSGRIAREIAITPMDDLRYGYRLWIDEATAMPLKSQLLDSRGRVIDQIVFTELKLPAHIADALLQPDVDARNYRWIRRDHAVVDAGKANKADAAGTGQVADAGKAVAWRAGELPAGFRMTVSAIQMLPGAAAPVEHMVFSDGLASVSVFVETQPGTSKGEADGTASVGSSSVYSTAIAGYRIIAIGEVPPDTVRSIARSMQAASPVAATDTASAAFTSATAVAPLRMAGPALSTPEGQALLDDGVVPQLGLTWLSPHGLDFNAYGTGESLRSLGTGAPRFDNGRASTPGFANSPRQGPRGSRGRH